MGKFLKGLGEGLLAVGVGMVLGFALFGFIGLCLGVGAYGFAVFNSAVVGG